MTDFTKVDLIDALKLFLWACGRCGAVVHGAEGMDRHIDWHGRRGTN